MGLTLNDLVRLGVMDADEAAEIAREWQQELDAERAHYYEQAQSYRLRNLGVIPHNYRAPDLSVPF